MPPRQQPIFQNEPFDLFIYPPKSSDLGKAEAAFLMFVF